MHPPDPRVAAKLDLVIAIIGGAALAYILITTLVELLQCYG
jgi:hypothetical protein